MFMVSIDADKCTGCKECTQLCPTDLIGDEGDKAVITGDPSECMGCMSCVSVCENEAITVDEY